MGISAFNATRNAMCVDSELMEPNICPVLIVVDHLHDFVRRGSPDGGIRGTLVAVYGLRLPVVVVVVKHQLERLAAVTTARVGFFNCQLRPVQHAQSEYLLRAVLDRPEETNTDLGQILRIRNVTSRTDIDVGMGVIEIVGRREL